MKKEKTAAHESDGLVNFNEQMNYKPNQNKFQLNSIPSRQSLLESTKLSRLPKLPTRSKFELPGFEISSGAAVAGCVGCGGRLESDNDFQQQIKVCRKCLAHYAVIDAAIDEASKRKRRELLDRFAGGGND